MSGNIMLKAIGRSAFITLLLVLLVYGLWHYTIITIIVIIFAWLGIMFYTDPPEDWDK